MSVSLYYTAKREQPISGQEQAACQSIVEQYIADYPLGEMYEPFCVYDLDEASGENIIFQGATKLPLDEGQEHFIDVHDYWTECLQKVIDSLPGAQWHIHIDDSDVTQYFDYPQ